MNGAFQKGLIDRITGKQQFTGDLYPANTLYGTFIRLRPARAEITGIRTDSAKAISGVTHVFTYKDFGGEIPRFGPDVMDQPMFADGETRFTGEPVGLVLAESEHASRKGAAAVEVDYRELTPILTAEEALDSSAHLVQDPRFRSDSPFKDTNIMGKWEYQWGDIGQGEKESDLIIENTYRAPFIHHFAMETPSVVSIPDDQEVTVYTPVQNPFFMRRILSTMLGIPANRIRVRSMDLGGSFGSKGYPKLEPAAVYYSLLLNRPVKISLSSEEAFYAAQREAAVIRIRTGFRKNGRLVFHEIDARFPVGAYMDISSRVVSKCTFHAVGPYTVDHASITGMGVFTNTPPTTAYRGFGNTHTGMAVEGQLDAAARKLEMDPVAIREVNVARKGETIIPKESPADGDWPELLKKASAAIGWETPKELGIGRGIAFGMKASKPATLSQARVVLNYDASASVYIGTTEMGQGTRTVMSGIVSRCLDIPLDSISIKLGDTGGVPFDALTAASRSVVNMGNALEDACRDIKSQLDLIAKKQYGEGITDLDLRNGTVFIGTQSVTLTELLIKHFGKMMGEIIGNGKFQGDREENHPLGGKAPFFEAVVTAVELSVDRDTGMVELKKIVHASDVGTLLNPVRAEGVDEGGNIMGVGIALSEQLIYGSDGQITNGSSLDYRIPTICDIPKEHLSVFQENHDGPGYRGAKGIGEGGMLAIVPAIIGAVFDATGIQFTEIPVTPERLWKALQK